MLLQDDNSKRDDTFLSTLQRLIVFYYRTHQTRRFNHYDEFRSYSYMKMLQREHTRIYVTIDNLFIKERRQSRLSFYVHCMYTLVHEINTRVIYMHMCMFISLYYSCATIMYNNTCHTTDRLGVNIILDQYDSLLLFPFFPFFELQVYLNIKIRVDI